MPRHAIDFTLGSRRLLNVPRDLATWGFGLDDVLAGDLSSAPPPGPDGVRVLSAPTARLVDVAACYPGPVAGARQDCRRHYIAMDGDFASYMARFSGKTRATLRRRARRLAAGPGGCHVTAHRTPAKIEAFLAAALPLSARTYQARLLGAGLPVDAAARRMMLEAAEDDRMHAFLLPVAHLSLPVSRRPLVYAHLGYDPDFAP